MLVSPEMVWVWRLWSGVKYTQIESFELPRNARKQLPFIWAPFWVNFLEELEGGSQL